MSKGFLVLAQNTDAVNYVDQAYALALSIKATQKEVKNITLVTNDAVPNEYISAFDKIVEIPWTDNAANSTWKIENRWKLYHATPYDETIVLDTDMLFLGDITQWWEYCSNYDLKFCSKVTNHKLQPITNDVVHRATFIANNLSNPYFALHYFKKSEFAHQFYKALEFVSNNWELCYSKFAADKWQNWLSMDLASAVAIEMLGIRETVIDSCSPLSFVHMKIDAQGWKKNHVSNWTKAVVWNFNKNGELYVGNIKQPALFHYVEKGFVTPTILSTLKELANGT